MNDYMDKSVEIANLLREEEIHTQVYLESGKMGKKFNYADKLNIPYVIVVGEEEAKTGSYSFRDMKTGEQKNLSIENIIQCLK